MEYWDTETLATDNNTSDNNAQTLGEEDWETKLSSAQAALTAAQALKEEYDRQIRELQRKQADAACDVEHWSKEVEIAQLEVPCQWNTMFKQLKAYKDEHGDCMVPHKYKPNKSLGRFVGNQRVFYKYYQNGDTKHIKAHRIKALSKLGFVWDVKEYNWNQSLQHLIDYKAANDGSTNVPKKYPQNQRLSVWVDTQRSEHSKYERGIASAMTPERKEQLDAIGFLWTRPLPPLSTDPYNQLRRKRKLQERGFEINNDDDNDDDCNRHHFRPKSIYDNKTQEQIWNMRFEALQKFYNHFGHCKVNQQGLSEEWKRFTLHNDLLMWVSYQRRQQLLFASGKTPSFITQEQIDKLNALNFKWKQPIDVPRKNSGTKKSASSTTTSTTTTTTTTTRLV